MKVRRQESEKIVSVGASIEPVKRPRRPHVMAIFSGQTLGCKQCGGDGGGGRSEGEVECGRRRIGLWAFAYSFKWELNDKRDYLSKRLIGLRDSESTDHLQPALLQDLHAHAVKHAFQKLAKRRMLRQKPCLSLTCSQVFVARGCGGGSGESIALRM